MEKNEAQEKLAFTTKENEVLLKNIAYHLREGLNIDSRINTESYGCGLYVDVNNYQDAIEIGSSYAIGYDQYEISWIDAYNNAHPVGYVPVMYGVLPQTVKGDYLWSIYDIPESKCPEDLKTYINDLREFCGTPNVLIEYNKFDNAFTILVTASFKNHALMVKRCKGFNYVNEHTPFIETYYPSSDNSLIIDREKMMKEKIYNLKSYFLNSLFHDILRFPLGQNIAPHNDKYPRHMGIYGGDTFLNQSEVEMLPENRLSVKGEFELHDTKGDQDTRKKYCVVTDKGNYVSEISFTQDEVSITTTINVARQIEGTDLDGQNQRDAFFTCLSEDGSQGTIVCKEHFVKISNGTRLLHYSDEFDFFEIFDLPNNWFIENGLNNETSEFPKVFDDVDFDRDDKDINEVYEILDSRKKNLETDKTLTMQKNGETK